MPKEPTVRKRAGNQSFQLSGHYKFADSQEKSDERILGDGEFVERILSENQEALDRRYTLKAEGVRVADVAERVAQVLGITTDAVWMPVKYERQVTARSRFVSGRLTNRVKP